MSMISMHMKGIHPWVSRFLTHHRHSDSDVHSFDLATAAAWIYSFNFWIMNLDHSSFWEFCPNWSDQCHWVSYANKCYGCPSLFSFPSFDFEANDCEMKAVSRMTSHLCCHIQSRSSNTSTYLPNKIIIEMNIKALQQQRQRHSHRHIPNTHTHVLVHVIVNAAAKNFFIFITAQE